MDPTTLVVAAGAIATGIGALMRGRGRKMEAEGEQDSANAKAVVELVAQLGELRAALEDEREARKALAAKVELLEKEREADQQQIETYARQAAEAEKRARVMAEQLADWMLKGTPSHGTLRPPR